EEGLVLHERTRGLMAEIQEAGKAAASSAPVPRGRLRISAPIVFAHVVLCPIAARFALAYPQVELEIIAEDRVVDPVDDGYDLVVRIDPAHNERLMGRCILIDQRLVVAAPTMSIPAASTRDMDRLSAPAVMFAAASGAPWEMRTRGGGARTLQPLPVLRLSSLLMVRDAVLQGVGAALLPRLLIAQDVAAGRLVCWGECGPPVEIWALYNSRRLLSAKVRAFLDMLKDLPNDN
ncbi:MAG: substrate binding domain-containing protein, partial [Janthinobacterium lividum]